MINKMIDAAPGNELPGIREASAYFQSQNFKRHYQYMKNQRRS